MVFLELPYTGFLTFEVRTDGSETCSVSLPRNGLCFPSSSANPWGTKNKWTTNKQQQEPATTRNKQANKQQPINKTKPTNQPKPGKYSRHLQFSPLLLFITASDERVAPCQTVGKALLPQTVPRSTREGIKKTLAYVYWWHGDILSLLLHSTEDCSSFFCCNSVISQTNEAQMKSIICSSCISFLFLSQFSSVEAAQATSSFSVFCHGKKNEMQEQENMVLL